MKPNYVANKSAWAAWSPLSVLITVLLFWTIIPIIVQVFRTISAKHYCLEFYDDKIVVKSGWLSTSTKTMTFNGVTSTSVKKSIWGSLFDYGEVEVDAVGVWDVSTSYIKYPEKLQAYLQTRIVKVQAQPYVHVGI